MIGELNIKEEEKGMRRVLSALSAFFARNWGRVALGAATFFAVSAIVYFTATRANSLVSFAYDEFEVGQISDKTIKAAKSIQPTDAYPVAIEEGETIIKKGFPVTETALTKLRKMSDSPVTVDYRAVGNSIFFLLLILALWVILFSERTLGKRVEMKELVLEAILFAVAYFLTSFASRSVVFNSPYKITVTVISTLCLFLVAILFGQRSAFLYTFVLSFGMLDATGFEVIPFVYTVATGLSAARIVRKINKRIDLVFESVLQAVFSVVIVVALNVIFNGDFKDGGFVIAGIAFNAFFSGIFVLGLLTPLENVMNTASVFRLMDLSETNSAPILQKMLAMAPGTHSHSLQVASLAEHACQKIGANALLAKVASYYHDIGKIDQAEYFTENQEGETKLIHEKYSPSMSASIIRNHVKKGVEEAKKLHLPKQVIDIIAEHHGNSVIAWFFKKAQDLDPNAREEDFMYPGRPPVSRESAVVMLADTAEAACRSLDNPSVPNLEKFIQKLIDAKISGKQLENCGLTFGELSIIKQSFVYDLAAHYHSRIKYPNQKEEEKSDARNENSEKPAENAVQETEKTVAQSAVVEQSRNIETTSQESESQDSGNRETEKTEIQPTENASQDSGNRETENREANSGNSGEKMANRVLVSIQEGLERSESNGRFFDLAQSGKIEEFVGRVLDRFGFSGEEISVLLCSDEFIREYNRTDRGIDAPTDILEYENGDSYTDEEGEWKIAGDMLISFETLPKNSAEFSTSENEELKRLLIHGTLHLNGMDHGDSHLEVGVEPEDEMLKKQEAVLAEFADVRLL